jgi:hypothetical protein
MIKVRGGKNTPNDIGWASTGWPQIRFEGWKPPHHGKQINTQQGAHMNWRLTNEQSSFNEAESNYIEVRSRGHVVATAVSCPMRKGIRLHATRVLRS